MNLSLSPSAKWALLVVDMQNDFLDKGGYYSRRAVLSECDEWTALSPEKKACLLEEATQMSALGVRSPAITQMVANVCVAISTARAADWPIAFVRSVYDRRFDTLRPLLSNDSTRMHFPCKPGTWGAKFLSEIADAIEQAPRRVERIFEKHTYDAFTCPSLLPFLQDNQINMVVVCGTETQVCVFATAQRAALLGFRAFILEDSVWSADSVAAHAALAIFRDAYGDTLAVGDLGSVACGTSGSY